MTTPGRSPRATEPKDKAMCALSANGVLDLDEAPRCLPKLLRPLPFDAEMGRHIASFTGRVWLFDELDRWLKGKLGSRVFWLIGGPGIGKTAVVTQLCRSRPEVIGCHFCTHGHAEKNDPEAMLFSLAYQMAQHLPEYAERLSNREIEQDGKNPGALFDSLIVEPLGKDFPAPDGPRLVVIDAIDEATSGNCNWIAELIRDKWCRTPPWLRLVITSRPELEVVSTLGHLDPYRLDAQRPENLEDLTRFIATELSARSIAASEAMLRKVVDKSEGMFLYARTLLDEIDQGCLTLDKLNALPSGLFGYYGRYFARQFPDAEQYSCGLRPLLEVVCAGREPVPTALVAAATGASGLELRTRLARAGSLFGAHAAAGGDTVAPFHKSVRDWLTAIDERTRLPLAGSYGIDAARGELRLADALSKELKGDFRRASGYALRHGPAHLVAVGRATEAAELLTEFGYHYERLRRLGAVDVTGTMKNFVRTGASALAPGELTARFEIWQRFYGEIAHRLQWDVVGLTIETHFLQLADAHGDESPVTRSATAWLQAGQRSHWWIRKHWRPKMGLPSVCQRTMEGHSDYVTGLTLHADGRRALSGSDDRTLKQWDIDTGECLCTLVGHQDTIGPVLLHTDGQRVLSGSDDHTLKLWDLADGECLRTLVGHKGAVSAAAIHADGRVAISGSKDGTIRVWDLVTGECKRVLEGHSSGVSAAALHPEGRIVVSGSWDKTVKVWDLKTGRCRHTLTGHDGRVKALAFPAGGRRVLSVGGLHHKVWNLDSGVCVHSLDWPSFSPGKHLELCADGRRCIVDCFGKLWVWDLETGACPATSDRHEGDVQGLRVLRDDRRAVSAGGEGALRVWDLDSRECLRTLTSHSAAVRAIVLHPDGRRVVSASEDKTLKVWDLAVEHRLNEPEPDAAEVSTVAFCGDGRRACSGPGSAFGLLQVWEIETGNCLAQSKEYVGQTISVPHPDGQRVVSACDQGKIIIWDLSTGHFLQSLGGQSPPAVALALHADGKRAVSADSYQLKVWDLENGRCLHTLRAEGNRCQPKAVALHPDERHAVTAGGGLWLWDIEAGACLRTVDPQGEPPLVLRSDGRLALATVYPNKLKIYDLEAEQCLRELVGHTDQIVAVALHPDGRTAVSASRDATLRLWDLETSECLRVLAGHRAAVTDLVLHPDGRHAMSTSEDKTIRLWDLENGDCLGSWPGDVEYRKCQLRENQLLVGGARGEVLLVDLMRPVLTVAQPRCCAWHPVRSLLAVGQDDGTLCIYEWHAASAHLEQLFSCAGRGSSNASLCWSSDSSYLSVREVSGGNRTLDVSTLREVGSDSACSWLAPSSISADGFWRAEIRDGRLEIVAAIEVEPAGRRVSV